MNELIDAITRCHQDPQRFQSNWSRANAYIIAEAACRGLITCLVGGVNIGQWVATARGIDMVERGDCE